MRKFAYLGVFLYLRVIMSKLLDLKTHLQPGQVYRREALAQWSKAVDRHIKQLVSDGVLTKLSGGLYYCPKKTAFGNSPAEDKILVEAFLKDDHFLLTSPNAYNVLRVGTTQLYSESVVYNHKRHGRFVLGGRTFDFRVKPRFPKRQPKSFCLSIWSIIWISWPRSGKGCWSGLKHKLIRLTEMCFWGLSGSTVAHARRSSSPKFLPMI